MPAASSGQAGWGPPWGLIAVPHLAVGVGQPKSGLLTQGPLWATLIPPESGLELKADHPHRGGFPATSRFILTTQGDFAFCSSVPSFIPSLHKHLLDTY